MEALGVIGAAVLGAVVASFSLVVAERVHTGQSFLKSRSRCNSCARILGPADLVPVVSWLFSGGRCFSCGSRVPAGYLVYELLLGTAFALSYLKLGVSFELLLLYGYLGMLSFTIAYDIRHTIVPIVSSVTLVLLALLFAWLTASTASLFGAVLLTAGAIGLAFVLLHAFTKGRAMGLGDAPIAFSLALVAGTEAIAGLLFSFWIGALFGIAVLVTRRGGPTMGIEVPFVPFLALGFLLAYFTGWNPLLI